MLVRLYPPYSTVTGRQTISVTLKEDMVLSEVFSRLVEDFPALREHFYLDGKHGFPGYASILRAGRPLLADAVVRDEDELEVLVGLSGG